METQNRVPYLMEIARQYPTLFAILHSAPTDFFSAPADFFCILGEEELGFLERELASFVALAEGKEKRPSLKLADMFPPSLPSPDHQAIQPYGDNFIPAIPVAPESITHTVERPLCSDMTCPCKNNLPSFADCETLSEEERGYVLLEGLKRVSTAERPKQGYYSSDTHSVALPFCKDPKCSCHEDHDLIAVIHAAYLAGEVTPQEATNIIAGKTF